MSAIQQYAVVEGPLGKNHRHVIVIHGMSTTAETLKEGYPPSDGLTKIYWRLPILRESRANLMKRRDEDVFQSLFAAVLDESRRELGLIINELGEVPVGLFGFSIGSLVALWGSIDYPQVRAVVTMGGVPSLDYLMHYYPDYPWDSPDIQERLQSYDVSRNVHLRDTALCIMHGAKDEVAKWEWMQNAASQWSNHPATTVEVRQFPHVQHRLMGEDLEEQTELATARRLADEWFVRYL